MNISDYLSDLNKIRKPDGTYLVEELKALNKKHNVPKKIQKLYNKVLKANQFDEFDDEQEE